MAEHPDQDLELRFQDVEAFLAEKMAEDREILERKLDRLELLMLEIINAERSCPECGWVAPPPVLSPEKRLIEHLRAAGQGTGVISKETMAKILADHGIVSGHPDEVDRRAEQWQSHPDARNPIDPADREPVEEIQT